VTHNKNLSDTPSVAELLADSPKNWGKWGAADEVGGLNYLTRDEVLRGISSVKQGKTFTLQVQMANPNGDPVHPTRTPAQRYNVMDRGHFQCGKGPHYPGGLEFTDDVKIMFLQGSSQYDALGHVWYGDQIYNGFDATTTIGGMSKASVLPLAERGIVGRGILLDVASHRGKAVLERGETFDHNTLLEVAEAQKVKIEKRDILLVRTGWIGSFYRRERDEFYKDWLEPGLTYSPELVRWFQEMEIPNLVTDTTANEIGTDPESGVTLPLHNALMRNLGVVFAEIMALDALAADCAGDGQWTFLYAAAPLKVVGGSGAPVNPIVIK
jgi:kynurenine formamidase